MPQLTTIGAASILGFRSVGSSVSVNSALLWQPGTDAILWQPGTDVLLWSPV